jgi:hypothetical protein
MPFRQFMINPSEPPKADTSPIGAVSFRSSTLPIIQPAEQQKQFTFIAFQGAAIIPYLPVVRHFSIIPPFHPSTIPLLHHSTIPLFHHSITPLFPPQPDNCQIFMFFCK